jgi:hypothetical protein
MDEVLDDYEYLIIEGMEFEDLPADDIEALKLLGQTEARGSLLADFLAIKQRGRMDPIDWEAPISTAHIMETLSESLAKEVQRLEGVVNQYRDTTSGIPEDEQKPRRWFKGLGKIAQGTALTVANVCLATSVLVLPVEPSSQTWGAIVSSITGVGTTLHGFGELIGE